jgi:ribosomal protein L7Ae-like RNA K-turn-binding protein
MMSAPSSKPSPSNTSSTSNSSKKRRRRQSDQDLTSQKPCRFSENESLSLISSIYGMIHTKYPSTVDRDVVIDRFKKEIVERFQLNNRRLVIRNRAVKKQYRLDDTVGEEDTKVKCIVEEDNNNKQKQWNPRLPLLLDIAMSRLRLGTNQCTLILERAMRKQESPPLLILLARDIRPPHMLAHIPALARQLSIPLLLLSGNTSKELGTILGINLCSIVLFLSHDKEKMQCNTDTHDTAMISRYHNYIDSFIEYAKCKIP